MSVPGAYRNPVSFSFEKRYLNLRMWWHQDTLGLLFALPSFDEHRYLPHVLCDLLIKAEIILSGLLLRVQWQRAANPSLISHKRHGPPLGDPYPFFRVRPPLSHYSTFPFDTGGHLHETPAGRLTCCSRRLSHGNFTRGDTVTPSNTEPKVLQCCTTFKHPNLDESVRAPISFFFETTSRSVLLTLGVPLLIHHFFKPQGRDNQSMEAMDTLVQ